MRARRPLRRILQRSWRFPRTTRRGPWNRSLGFPAIRHKKQDIDGFSGFADTYVLDAKDDPWASDEPAQWENGSLVRRFTFILWFYKAKLIVEYRDALPSRPPICRLRTISPC